MCICCVTGPDGIQLLPVRISNTSSSSSSSLLLSPHHPLNYKQPLHHPQSPFDHQSSSQQRNCSSSGGGGSSSTSSVLAAAAAAAAAAHHHHHHHHQMSYHNMFSPTRELAGTMWRCRTCGKEVTNRWHHFHSHTAQRSVCPYCPATYSRIDTLRSHLRVKHPDRLIKN